MTICETAGCIGTEVCFEEVTACEVVVDTTKPRKHVQLTGISLCLLGRNIAGIDISYTIVREVLAISVPVLVVVSLCMPTSQSTNVMLSEGLVVVQQCLEGLALPLVNSLVVEIRVGLLVLIVNEVLLEVVVVLVVVYIRSTQLCYQAIDDLVVNTEETGKVGITTIYLQIVVEPCDRATIRNGSPCAVIITGGNP